MKLKKSNQKEIKNLNDKRGVFFWRLEQIILGGGRIFLALMEGVGAISQGDGLGKGLGKGNTNKFKSSLGFSLFCKGSKIHIVFVNI